LTDLRQSLSGNLITPADTGYSAMYLANNLEYRGIKPIGIAVCKNEEDIAAFSFGLFRVQPPFARK
jgi:hypothetical protein